MSSKLSGIKSSFSGIKKYSGVRGNPFPSIYDWLKTKRKDDDIGNLWRVHDSLYDLEEFVDRHPGGDNWIRFSRGCDITEAFESSHVVNVNRVESILAKYFVRKASKPRNSPYTFKENGFYKTLKRRVEPVLKKVGNDFGAEAIMIQDGVAITYLLLAILGAMHNSVAIQIFAGIFLHMTVTAAHNFFHKKDNWRLYYFDLCPLSSYEWRMSHAFSHHLYPNTILDFEVQLGEPMIEMLPNRPRNYLQNNPVVMIAYYHFIIMFQSLLDIPRRAKDIYLGKAAPRPENLLVLIELALFMYVAPNLWVGIQTWFIVCMVSSFLFIIVPNNSSHHYPTCFHDGDEARYEPDFGLCQLDATKGKSDWYHKSLFSVLTTFGEHPLHHLFPTVCHSKLQYIKPIVLETISEFSEEFPELQQWELYKGTLRQLTRTKPHKLSDYKNK